jgi:hypothetical protein
VAHRQFESGSWPARVRPATNSADQVEAIVVATLKEAPNATH